MVTAERRKGVNVGTALRKGDAKLGRGWEVEAPGSLERPSGHAAAQTGPVVSVVRRQGVPALRAASCGDWFVFLGSRKAQRLRSRTTAP